MQPLHLTLGKSLNRHGCLYISHRRDLLYKPIIRPPETTRKVILLMRVYPSKNKDFYYVARQSGRIYRYCSSAAVYSIYYILQYCIEFKVTLPAIRSWLSCRGLNICHGNTLLLLLLLFPRISPISRTRGHRRRLPFPYHRYIQKNK